MALSGEMTAARLVRRCNPCSKHGVVSALSSPSQSSSPRRQFSTTDRRRSQDSYKLLVLGGGTAGSAVANKFAAKLGRGNVAVVEPSKVRRYSSLQVRLSLSVASERIISNNRVKYGSSKNTATGLENTDVLIKLPHFNINNKSCVEIKLL